MSDSPSYDDILKELEAARRVATAPTVSALAFDKEKYLSELEDTDLTEEQKIDMLQALWSIMEAFVDLGFGINSIHQFFSELAAESSESGMDRVESGNGKCRENFEDAADCSGAKEGDS